MIEMEVKLGSINVQGLGNRLKRRQIFNWLRGKRYYLSGSHCCHELLKFPMFPSGFNRSLNNSDLIYNGFTAARNALQRLRRFDTITSVPYRRSRAGKLVRERLLHTKNLKASP